jgi:hypothetical protein
MRKAPGQKPGPALFQPLLRSGAVKWALELKHMFIFQRKKKKR